MHYICASQSTNYNKELHLKQNEINFGHIYLRLVTQLDIMSESEFLQYVPFASAFDAGFWYKLSKKKIDDYKLDDTPVSIKAFYSNSK